MKKLKTYLWMLGLFFKIIWAQWRGRCLRCWYEDEMIRLHHRGHIDADQLSDFLNTAKTIPHKKSCIYL